MSDRRSFFRQFLGHMNIAIEESRGRQHFKLSDVWEMDEPTFRQLKLRLREDVTLRIEGKNSTAIKSNEQPVALYITGTEEEALFAGVKKHLSVEEMIQELQRSFGHETDAGYRLTRDYLLSLVKQEILVPANDVYLPKTAKKEEMNE
ncbi:MAG: hypothetical protein EHM72_21185 [Calditrichaeota bacterium]|nr:MAG: hypothetical protein EHM72_21185 [Calditrichota bacterium]